MKYQAAVLDVKLKYIDEENKKRRMIAKYYHQHIKNDKILLPGLPADEEETCMASVCSA